MVEDYRTINRANWDERAPAHAASPDYAVARFLEDPSYISQVVRFDLPLLGDISGQRGVHLQCHIGTDTISLARLGASMTGLDFSPPRARAGAPPVGSDRRRRRVRAGRRLRRRRGPRRASASTSSSRASARCAGCRASSAGQMSWPSLLAPGGRLFLREGHPMLWALDETARTACSSSSTPTSSVRSRNVWSEGGTYVQTDVPFAHNTSLDWNHGLGETRHALLDARPADHRARRARQRALGCAARPDGRARLGRVPPGRPPLAAGPQLHAAGPQGPLNSAGRSPSALRQHPMLSARSRWGRVRQLSRCTSVLPVGSDGDRPDLYRLLRDNAGMRWRTQQAGSR